MSFPRLLFQSEKKDVVHVGCQAISWYIVHHTLRGSGASAAAVLYVLDVTNVN